MSHAIFSPSSAHRWINCPLSLKLSQKIVNIETESPEALEGREAHEKLSKLIYSYYRKDKDIQPDISNQYVNETFNYIKSTYPRNEFMVDSEVTLYYSEWLYGTADVMVFSRDSNSNPTTNVVAILDFKYGQIPVEVMYNSQLLMYAYLAEKIFGQAGSLITLSILQPRIEGKKWHSWIIDHNTLTAFSARVSEAMNYYFDQTTNHRGYPTKQTEDVCKFCPVRYENCPHTVNAVEKSLIITKDNLPEIKKEQEIFLLQNRSKIVNYLDSLHARYKEAMKKGFVVEGLRLTKDKEIKVWKNEEEAKSLMEINGINPYTVKLKTPTQVAKEKEILGIESLIKIERKGSYIVEDN